MSVPRFYIPPSHWDIDHLALRDGEAHHCAEVLRLRQGERVVAFNGKGLEVGAQITLLSKHEVGLEVMTTSQSSPPACHITLAQAIPKGKNMELILQKATELGAAAIQPLLSQRTIVRLDAKEAKDRREKWQRVAIEACKQCGQNHVPHVHEPVSVEALFSRRIDCDLPIIAAIDPAAQRLQAILSEYAHAHPAAPVPRKVMILIGPEGDFTPAEMGVARSAGCYPLSLGPIILRTETAALYTLSTLAHELF